MKAKLWLIPGSAALCVLAGLCVGFQGIRDGAPPARQGLKLPFIIYDEKGDTNNHYTPSGWMGNFEDVKMEEGCSASPHGGKTCLRFEYNCSDDWAGVVWQDPGNDWGDRPGGWNLTGATKLTFWARGENGGETVTFKFGILGTDRKYFDSAGNELDDIKLTTDWKQYSIDLAGKDLTRIKTGFTWTLAGQGRPVIFYLDDIRFE
ncbi:MAG TPA: hypothetical protein VN048_02875 [Verrucomicrobiae bacterium]|jgi:hypothetical protein|nr:hypothetical protein [Verrucomicrobiae bacterium]